MHYEVRVVGVGFSSVPGDGAGLASSASLALAIISSSDVTARRPGSAKESLPLRVPAANRNWRPTG